MSGIITTALSSLHFVSASVRRALPVGFVVLMPERRSTSQKFRTGGLRWHSYRLLGGGVTVGTRPLLLMRPPPSVFSRRLADESRDTNDGYFTDGARESAQDWRDLLLDLKRRGLDVPPQLTIADGALGFWKAAGEVWPKTREQRCWVHKTANVLAKLPKSQQPKAKRALQEIWMAETKAVAELAFDAFIESFTPKFEKAADCLSRDRDALLAFYDFPAEHWKHLRTTNPIESTFATVRHRTIRSKGCLSNKTALAMVFKLLEAAQKSWRRLDGHNQLPKLVLGVTFNDGIEVIAKPTDRQPATAAA